VNQDHGTAGPRFFEMQAHPTVRHRVWHVDIPA
jgi:hypothetical protein